VCWVALDHLPALVSEESSLYRVSQWQFRWLHIIKPSLSRSSMRTTAWRHAFCIDRRLIACTEYCSCWLTTTSEQLDVVPICICDTFESDISAVHTLRDTAITKNCTRRMQETLLQHCTLHHETKKNLQTFHFQTEIILLNAYSLQLIVGSLPFWLKKQLNALTTS